MTQRAFPDAPAPAPMGIHVGIIMDGNGRWAVARAKSRIAGHREGARAVRRVVEAAPDCGVGILTLYAFSSDNWSRPRSEVSALMRLFRHHLLTEIPELVEQGVALAVIGRRDRLAPRLLNAIAEAEAATRAGTTLRLRVAVDYSARDAIVAAARRAAATGTGGGEALDREGFATLLGRAIHDEQPVPDLDLIVRTGGERRLSDFLLWEAAYAELHFTDRMWPDFGAAELGEAVADFRRRDRRFGRVPTSAAV